MARKDAKEAKVYEVVHSGVGAICDKGPWQKGNHIVREHFTEDELPHLDRLIDKGAIKPVEYADLDDLEESLASREMTLADIPKNPWTEMSNVNNDYAKLMADRAKAKREAAALAAIKEPAPARGHREVTDKQ